MLIAALGDPPDPVAGAADKLIQTGVLGALLVLVGAFAFYAVIRWNRANESRVKDQKEMSEALTSLTTGLKGALVDLNGTTNALREAVVASTTQTATMQTVLNDVVKEAVRAGVYRRMSPPGGTPAAKPPGE